MQLGYNVGSLSDALANATRLVQLSAKVFKDKESEIQRVPLMNLLFEAQIKSKKTNEAIKTMEEIIQIYKRATQGAPMVEASPPSGVSTIDK